MAIKKEREVMNEKMINNLNGFGIMLRFITPVLVTIAIFLITWIKSDVGKLDVHFTNHLEHHQDLEVGYERRLTAIESTCDHGD